MQYQLLLRGFTGCSDTFPRSFVWGGSGWHDSWERRTFHPMERPLSGVLSIKHVTLVWLVASWREQWLEWREHGTEATVTCDPASGGNEYPERGLGTCCAKFVLLNTGTVPPRLTGCRDGPGGWTDSKQCTEVRIHTHALLQPHRCIVIVRC